MAEFYQVGIVIDKDGEADIDRRTLNLALNRTFDLLKQQGVSLDDLDSRVTNLENAVKPNVGSAATAWPTVEDL